jgi:hypothetical protein
VRRKGPHIVIQFDPVDQARLDLLNYSLLKLFEVLRLNGASMSSEALLGAFQTARAEYEAFKTAVAAE